MKITHRLATAAFVLTWIVAPVCKAAYLVEVDLDGTDDGFVDFNPDFSFDLGTEFANESSPSNAFGMNGGDSIFGGDGFDQMDNPDTYVVTYRPDAQEDNLTTVAGANLGDGNLATALTGGDAGTYAIYATWPPTANVTGGPTLYTVETDGAMFDVELDQNGRGGQWAKVGEIEYTSGSIRVMQQPTEGNTFVSMRLAGMLFELQPEFDFAADFDKDGDVDGDDFLVWQSNFGTMAGATRNTGDADGDGDVDGDDFLSWQSEFGSGPDEGRGGGTVPEPASATLLALAAVACGRRRAGR